MDYKRLIGKKVIFTKDTYKDGYTFLKGCNAIIDDFSDKSVNLREFTKATPIFPHKSWWFNPMEFSNTKLIDNKLNIDSFSEEI